MGGSRDTGMNALTVVPTSSRPSAIVTSVTDLAGFGGAQLVKRPEPRVDADGSVVLQPGALAGHGDSVVHAARLVGQAVGHCVRSGPDPAAGQLVHPVRRQPPPGGYLLREVPVQGVEPD